MPLSPSGKSPAEHDVIVKRTDDSSGRCILGTLHAPRQFLCVSYDEAIARARTYAKTSKVRVWQTDDDQTFTLLPLAAMAKSGSARRKLSSAS